jgi:hypothetical protein
MHTHIHSGDRQWTDEKCPICRARRASVVDLKDELSQKEKEEDKLLLHLSLALDREYINKTKVWT